MTVFKTIGVQQYMFRDHFRDEAEAARTLKRIRKIGFSNIELCGFLMGPDESEEYDWKALLAQADMKVCGIHDALENLLKNLEAMIEKAKKLNTRYLVAGASVETDFSCVDSVTKLIKNINNLGELLKDRDLALLYHNHNMEYEKAGAEQITGMERIIDGIDPNYVKLEIDTFWMQKGGANPVAWCEKAKGKIEFLHINDCGVPRTGPGVPIRDTVGAELGRGNMELQAIADTVKKSNCDILILETHDDWINGDPFESAEISYAYIKKHWCYG